MVVEMNVTPFQIHALMQLKRLLWIVVFTLLSECILQEEMHNKQTINYLVMAVGKEFLSPSSHRKCAFWKVLICFSQIVLKPH